MRACVHACVQRKHTISVLGRYTALSFAVYVSPFRRVPTTGPCSQSRRRRLMSHRHCRRSPYPRRGPRRYRADRHRPHHRWCLHTHTRSLTHMHACSCAGTCMHTRVHIRTWHARIHAPTHPRCTHDACTMVAYTHAHTHAVPVEAAEPHTVNCSNT